MISLGYLSRNLNQGSNIQLAPKKPCSSFKLFIFLFQSFQNSFCCKLAEYSQGVNLKGKIEKQNKQKTEQILDVLIVILICLKTGIHDEHCEEKKLFSRC